jgi:acyl-CoA synthetase (AMP-forming)/AMP-acid ligase II
MIKTALARVAQDGPDLAATATAVTDCLAPLGAQRVVTLFLAVVDARRENIEYLNAGHPPPLIWGGSAAPVELPATTPLLSFGLGLAREPVRRQAFGPGQRLAVYSDGVYEVRDPSGAEWGREPLVAVIQAAKGSIDEIARRILERSRTHAGGRPPEDDLTLRAAVQGEERSPRGIGVALRTAGILVANHPGVRLRILAESKDRERRETTKEEACPARRKRFHGGPLLTTGRAYAAWGFVPGPGSAKPACGMPALITLAQAIEEAARVDPDPTRGFRFVPEDGAVGAGGAQPGAGSSEASFSYVAIERASARYGGALQALGLKKGDRVALVLPTNEDFVLCFLGAVRAGVIPVPIYPPLGLGQLQGYLDNTRHIVAKSGARTLVTSAKIKRLLGTVQSTCPALEEVVAVEGIRESMESLKPEKIGMDDVAFLQFTSGSTSRPKGVALTHENLARNVKCIMHDGLAMGEGDVGVSWLPLYHDMGLIGFVLAPLFHRVPCVFLPPLLFLKRPVSWFQAISRHKGTIAFGPNFAYALCVKRIREKDLAGIDLSTWRVAGCGAEPIRPETLEGFADAFARVGFKKEALLASYGMAESTLAVAFTELGEGMKTIAVDGEALWATNEARPIAEEATVRHVGGIQLLAQHRLDGISPQRNHCARSGLGCHTPFTSWGRRYHESTARRPRVCRGSPNRAAVATWLLGLIFLWLQSARNADLAPTDAPAKGSGVDQKNFATISPRRFQRSIPPHPGGFPSESGPRRLVRSGEVTVPPDLRSPLPR